MFKNFKTSKKGTVILFLAIFAFMLILNGITPIYADDYSYVYHFKTGEVIESIPDIIDSLKYHAETCNGRLISHFFVHLFMMLPWIVFDIVNSAMFVLFIYLSSRLANVKRERDNVLTLIIFIFTFMFHPAFGEEFLWVAGACNYMWAMVAGLIFLLPMHSYLVFDKKLHPALWVLYIPFGFVAGAFLENVSAGVIFTGALYIIITKFVFKKRFRIDAILSLAMAGLGYIFMATRPGTSANKISTFADPMQTLRVILMMGLMVLVLAVPILLYIQLLVKSKRVGVSKEVIFSTIILLAGGMASNGVLLFAVFYPKRCAIGLASMVICATAMLYNAAGGLTFGRFTKKILCVFFTILTLYLGVALADIIITRVQFDRNEAHIEECKAAGIYDVRVDPITPRTKYSGAKGMTHLMPNPDHWPNCVIDKYYGLDTILLK